jgi:hypothetical protein
MPTEFNRAAAFLEYSKGTPLEDVSHALAIPLNHLKRWCHEENWPALVPQLPATTALAKRDPAEEHQALEKIKANRERNLRIAQALQEDLLEVVDKMRKGELKVTRVFANGRKEQMDPGLRDRNDLALYARNVADMSYRALGDVPESAKNPHAPDGIAAAGQIIIALPQIVAAPRQLRPAVAVDIEAQVAGPNAPEDTRSYALSAPSPSVEPSPTSGYDTQEPVSCGLDRPGQVARERRTARPGPAREAPGAVE